MNEEQTEKKEKKRRAIILILLLLLIALAGILLFVLLRDDGDKTAIAEGVRYAEDQDYSDIEENPSIAVPGYESLKFKAGETTQEVTLRNPEVNTCYFKMRLILPDGTCIWESDLLEPGMSFPTITLTQPLEAGEYPDTLLKYDCYSLKDQSQLNGAEIKLNLIVS